MIDTYIVNLKKHLDRKYHLESVKLAVTRKWLSEK